MTLRRGLVMLVLATVAAASPIARAQADARSVIREANERYRKGEFATALEGYERAEKLDPRSVEAVYNQGCTLYELGKKDEAESKFRQALASEGGKRIAAAARYNLGRLEYERAEAMAGEQQKELGEKLKAFNSAAEEFRGALDASPRDVEAARNLELSRTQARAIQKRLDDLKKLREAMNKAAQELKENQKAQEQESQDSKQDAKQQKQEEQKQQQSQPQSGGQDQSEQQQQGQQQGQQPGQSQQGQQGESGRRQEQGRQDQEQVSDHTDQLREQVRQLQNQAQRQAEEQSQSNSSSPEQSSSPEEQAKLALENAGKAVDEARKKQSQAEKQLKDGDPEKASEQQRQASEKLKEAAEQLAKQSQQGKDGEQQEGEQSEGDQQQGRQQDDEHQEAEQGQSQAGSAGDEWKQTPMDRLVEQILDKEQRDRARRGAQQRQMFGKMRPVAKDW